MAIITFDTAYNWLNKFEMEKSFLSLSTRALVQLLDEAWKAGDYHRMLITIDSIDHVTAKFKNSLEIGEANLQVGRWLLAMLLRAKDLPVEPVINGQVTNQDVIIRLKDSANNYLYGANPHNQGIALWLAGWVLLDIQKLDDALYAWERSLELYKRLANGPFIERITSWYLEQAAAMEETIAKEISEKYGLKRT